MTEPILKTQSAKRLAPTLGGSRSDVGEGKRGEESLCSQRTGLLNVSAGAVELDQAQAGVKSSVHSRLPPTFGVVSLAQIVPHLLHFIIECWDSWQRRHSETRRCSQRILASFRTPANQSVHHTLKSLTLKLEWMQL